MKIVQGMYKSQIAAQCAVGMTEWFEMKVWSHQELTFLFEMFMSWLADGVSMKHDVCVGHSDK